MKKILIVDDVEANLYSLEALLDDIKSSYNFEIIKALGGEQALKLALVVEDISLIILDIQMPDINGFEVAKILKSSSKTKDIPIIFLTAAFKADEFIMQGYNVGAVDYFTKPIEKFQFINKVIVHLEIQSKNRQLKEINDKLSSLTNSLEKKVELKTEDLEQSKEELKQANERLKQANERLKVIAFEDKLTQLPNRSAFYDEKSKYNNVMIILINIDGFKYINEVFGDENGNRVLIKFAQHLNAFAKKKSYRLFRLNGDEFVMMYAVDYYCHVESQNLIDNILDHVALFIIEIEHTVIQLDVSVALAHGNEKLLEHIDATQRYAKKQQKKFAIYSEEMDDSNESADLLSCVKSIKNALEKDLVTPVYQGITDIKGNLIKYEALMRLKDDDGKLISPFFFLDVAKKTKLYPKLARIMFKKVVQTIQKSNYDFSINFTYSDILNETFLKDCEDLIKYTHIAEQVIFEVTEDEQLSDFTKLQSFVKRFKKLGVRIAIDDFGSGFANFSHILDLEPDYLKIDGSLVRDIESNLKVHKLVSGIIKLAKDLEIKTIAEYVENKEIFQILKSQGVDEFQGFYFYKPELWENCER